MAHTNTNTDTDTDAETDAEASTDADTDTDKINAPPRTRYDVMMRTRCSAPSIVPVLDSVQSLLK